MKVWKKLISLLLALSLATGFFTGCGKDPQTPVGPTPEPPKQWDKFTDAVVDGELNPSLFPDMPVFKKLFYIDYDFGLDKVYGKSLETFSEVITISALQGLICKDKSATEGIYLNVNAVAGAMDGFSQNWLDEFVQYDKIEAVKVEEKEGVQPYLQMAKKFAGAVKQTDAQKPGYILYEQQLEDAIDPEGNPIKRGSQSLNAACTAAGITGYLPVDKSLKEQFDAIGYEQAMDVSDWTEERAFDEYKDKINKKAISLTPNAYAENRDLGIAGGFFFMDECYKDNNFNTTKLQQVFPFGSGALLMGWGSEGEGLQISKHGAFGFGFACTVFSFNLTTFMSTGRKCFRQRNDEQEITADPGKHYVAMMMTDGDNISWHQNDFALSNRYFGYSLDKKQRAENPFKMGYWMSPIMADLTPAVARFEYMNSSPFDYFYAPPSGAWISYPSTYGEANKESLNKLAAETNAYMKRMDLEYTQISDLIDFDDDVVGALAAQPNVKGGFVNYSYQGGDLKWYNGKPFVGMTDTYWGDTPGRVAYRLNSLKPDIKSINGYTLLSIHCWTTTMTDVANMVKKLDKHIEIVSPGELLKLVEKNVAKQDSERTQKPDKDYPADVDEYLDAKQLYETLPLNPKSRFTFDTYLDYEGWEKWIGPKVYDMITFSGEFWKYSTTVRTTADGGAGYSLRLDGGDYGLTDNTPNASVYSKLKVPDDDGATFRFMSRGEAYGFDNDMRTRIIYKDGDRYVIEELKSGYEYPDTDSQKAWTVNGDHLWKETVYDVGRWKGQEVIFVIEQNGTKGEGDGEIMYLDNIQIGVDRIKKDTVKQAVKNPNSSDTKSAVSFGFGSDAMGWQSYAADGAAAAYKSGALTVTTTAKRGEDLSADGVWYTKLCMPKDTGFSHYKYGAFVKAAAGKTALARIGGILPNGDLFRGGGYRVIDDRGAYLTMELDTYHVKGGSFKYFYPFIEVASFGAAAQVSIDDINFAPYLRDTANGYFMDKEYMLSIGKTAVADLSSLTAWTLEAGRGLEDEAIVENGKIRLYGYDFMRYKEDELISKKVGGYSKVKNEFNARMFARIDVGTTSRMTFDVQKIAKTKKNEPTTTAQYRVLFLTDGGEVIELARYAKLARDSVIGVSVDLSGVQNKSGVIMVDFDVEGNAQRSGITVNNVLFA